MCRPVTCRTCGGKTWAGCGLHVADVMRAVPQSRRCRCPQDDATPRAGILSFLRPKR